MIENEYSASPLHTDIKIANKLILRSIRHQTGYARGVGIGIKIPHTEALRKPPSSITFTSLRSLCNDCL